MAYRLFFIYIGRYRSETYSEHDSPLSERIFSLVHFHFLFGDISRRSIFNVGIEDGIHRTGAFISRVEKKERRHHVEGLHISLLRAYEI